MRKIKLSEQQLIDDIKQFYSDFSDFNPGQKECIEAILSGRDLVAVMPTGGGKSLCYQYPATKLKGVTIIVSPLISLMQDQADSLEKKGVKTLVINSAQGNKGEMIDKMKDALKGEYKVILVSPERLQTPNFMLFAQSLDISMLVVDEAHCISLWGVNFRESYTKIGQFISLLPKRPIVAAFTATATQDVIDDIMRFLDMKEDKTAKVIKDTTRENLKFSVREIKNERYAKNAVDNELSAVDNNKLYELHRTDIPKHKGENGIIFCATTEHVKMVSESLKKEKRYKDKVCIYYAGLKVGTKNEQFERFINGDGMIMVATNAFGMGIDKRNVRYVIHFDMPKSLEDYSQEAGRAGRDDKPASCCLYYCAAEDSKPKNEWRLQSDLDELRFKVMKMYAALNDDKLSGFMHEYFDKDFYAKTGKRLGKEYNRIKDNIEAQYEKIDADMRNNRVENVFMNTTKIANILRSGDYKINEPKKVDVSKNGRATVEFTIDTKLSYFDMMVADAVYSLEFYKASNISAKAIIELLSSDKDATLKPEKLQRIYDSIEKMRHTHIKIDRTNAMRKKSLFYENETVFEGAFLPLNDKQGKVYKYSEKPPLYRYAEASNGEFFMIKEEYLSVCIPYCDEKGNIKLKSMPISCENLKLRYYLAYRVILARPRKSKRQDNSQKRFKSRMSRVISFDTMLNQLQLDMPDDKYLYKRKCKQLIVKIQEILNYYTFAEIIKDYKAIQSDEKISWELDYFEHVENNPE